MYIVLSAQVAKAQYLWSLQQYIKHGLMHKSLVQFSLVKSLSEDYIFSVRRNQLFSTVNANHIDLFGHIPLHNEAYTYCNKITPSFNMPLHWTIFNGFKTQNMLQKSKLHLMMSDINILKIDISVNITSSYLQMLFCKELLTIASKQVMISNEILRKARMLHAIDKNRRVNVVESETTITSDKLKELKHKNKCNLVLPKLFKLSNCLITVNFDAVNSEIYEEILILELPLSTSVFHNASLNTPSITLNKYKMESLRQEKSISKSIFYPAIMLQTDYENSYYYSNIKGHSNSGFSSQLRKYSNRFVGNAVRVPIFNELQTYNNVKSDQLNNMQVVIQLDESYLELKKKIKLAYQYTVVTQGKFYVITKKIEDTAVVYLDEERKYMLGKSPIFNFNEIKNNYWDCNLKQYRQIMNASSA